jgi:triphosphatase
MKEIRALPPGGPVPADYEFDHIDAQGMPIQFDYSETRVSQTTRGTGHISQQKPKVLPIPPMQSRRHMLEQDQVAQSLAPRNAEVIALETHQRAEQATYDILRECLAQITANMAVVQGLPDPEGPHQLRVGLRRLRTAFTALWTVLDSPEMTRLGQEARWLGQEVGRLRDIEVVKNEIVPREAEAHPQQPGFPAIADRLRREVTKRREDLRQLLGEARSHAFLIDLSRFVETRGWHVAEDLDQAGEFAIPLRKLARKALTKTWKKVRKRGRGIENLNAEQRHELRKALKKLRYTVEFFSSLYAAKKVERFGKRLKKLQQLCGDVNDAAMVASTFSEKGMLSDADPKSQRAIGCMIGANKVRAEFVWRESRDHWRRLKKIQLFWK